MKKSKKMIAMLLSLIVVMICCAVPVSAENEEYGAYVNIQPVVYYNSDASHYGNMIYVNMVLFNIEEYKYSYIYIDYNKDVLEYNTLEFPDDETMEDCDETETGVYFKATFAEYSMPGRPDPESVNMRGEGRFHFVVKGEGDLNLNVYAYAIDLNGEKVDLNLDYTPPYSKVVNISEVEFLDLDEQYRERYFSIFTGEIKVKEILSKVSAKSAVIKNAQGEILADDDFVPNNSKLTTLYNGYEVDSLSVCIMYDVDCDGIVTASDARLTLRVAADIEQLNEFMYNAANIDNESGITASDARLILRKSAGLD